MFERFTDQARRVIVLAREEARGLDHDSIGTEHLLLALAGRDVSTEKMLASAGVTLSSARTKVAELVGKGDEESPTHIPFTGRAKKVLDLSQREALRLGHNYAGAEHLLLALLDTGDDAATKVVEGLGADPARLREEARKAPEEVRPERNRQGMVGRLAALEDQVRALSSQVTELQQRLNEAV
jgi:ATP-dependent Clp protease ATP-binding subunit ClpC